MTEAQVAMSIFDLPMQNDRETGWRMLREQGPVALVDGMHFITTAKGVEEVLQNPDVYSSATIYHAVMGAPVRMVPLEFDPPDVLRYRRLLAPFFSPGVIGRLQDSLRQQAKDLITVIAGKGSADIVPELAVPYPSQVFLTLMGLPMADQERLLGWKDAIIGAADPTASGRPPQERVAELVDYLKAVIVERKGKDGDDLLTRVVNDPSPDALDDEEVLGMAYLLISAGLDTVTSTIALAFDLLARDPALRQQLAADLSLIPNFVEEVVRLNPVACFTPRSTTRDTVLEGVSLPEGTMVSMAFAVANRDPAVFADPTVLDLERQGHHFGFGGGVHRCLGSHLARAELKLVFEEWLTVIPEFTFQEGADPQMPWPVGLLTLPSVPLSFPPFTA